MSVQVLCPHCHERIEALDDDPLVEVLCSACDKSFALISSFEGGESTEQRVGKFLLLEQLGVGGFGTVWKAQDTELDRLVAVKIPHQVRTSRGDGQFLREARATAQLRHPNIASIHEISRSPDGQLYIVSDLVDGPTLSSWLGARKVSFHETARLVARIADAIGYAHSQGVVHRDLKPQNILIDADDEPHIVDFGLAKRDVGDVTVTVDGQILGTPAYMSPEQASGRSHESDTRSDIYSLGVILFELLTGELPFRGERQIMLTKIIEERAPEPQTLRSGVPRDLATLCMKCLEKNPEQRFTSANVFADELRRFFQGEPIVTRPPGVLDKIKAWCSHPKRVKDAGLVSTILATIGLFWSLLIGVPGVLIGFVPNHSGPLAVAHLIGFGFMWWPMLFLGRRMAKDSSFVATMLLVVIVGVETAIMLTLIYVVRYDFAGIYGEGVIGINSLIGSVVLFSWALDIIALYALLRRRNTNTLQPKTRSVNTTTVNDVGGHETN